MSKRLPVQPGNPLRQPQVATKWYRVDEFRVTVEKCRACGKPFTITRDHLLGERYVVCPCGRGCFEVEVRILHTVDQEPEGEAE